jgi:phage-related protein
VASTHAVYYRDADGTQPVDDFLEGIGDPRCQALLDLQIDRMNGLPVEAPPLPFPATSQVDGPLRELRCHCGKTLYRILYRRSDNLFVLLHAFRKTAAKVPQSEIDIARARWSDFEARMQADPREPPRAACPVTQ